MPKYNFYYGAKKNEFGGYSLLGEVDYPYELQKNDVVIIGGKFLNKIKDKGLSENVHQQYSVGSVHHWIDPVSTADVYLVEEESN